MKNLILVAAFFLASGSALADGYSGGAGGGVPSIAGTANQICQTGSPGAVTLTLCASVVTPGSLEVTTTTQFDGLATANAGVTVSGSALTLSGPQSAAAWTTSGIALKQLAATYTDTSSSGTVTNTYINALGVPTIAASGATTYTNAFGLFVSAPLAGTNVTITNSWALGAQSLKVGAGSPLTVSATGVLTATNANLTTANLNTPSAINLSNATALPDSALSANVPLLNAANIFTAANTDHALFTADSLSVGSPAFTVSAAGVVANPGGANIGGATISAAGSIAVPSGQIISGPTISAGSTGIIRWASRIILTSPADIVLQLQNNTQTITTNLSIPVSAALQLGAADVASGAVAQLLTCQGNTGATTNGPVCTIRGPNGGSSTSVGGELRLSGGLAATVGSGGAVTIYTSASGAGATPVLALSVDNAQLLNLGAASSLANGTAVTTVTNLGPTGTTCTIGDWFKLKDGSGNTRYIPMFTCS